MAKIKQRCEWCTDDPIYIDYHDNEWGKPNKDKTSLFEMLCLEGAQAGLSWITVLKKREHYRKVFDGFDANKIARYDEKKKQALLNDSGIIRNKLKVNAFIQNACAFLQIEDKARKNQGVDFVELLWSFVGGEPVINRYTTLSEIPANTAESDAMSHTLKKLGFKFVGSTICYAFMQATGMVNDHVVSCPCHPDNAVNLY